MAAPRLQKPKGGGVVVGVDAHFGFVDFARARQEAYGDGGFGGSGGGVSGFGGLGFEASSSGAGGICNGSGVIRGAIGSRPLVKGTPTIWMD